MPPRTVNARGRRQTALDRRAFASVGVAILASCTQSGEAARFERLIFQTAGADTGTFVAQAVGLTFTLTGPDEPRRATVWEGPLEIRHEQRGVRCRRDASLVTAVYVSSDARSAAIVTYSGSLTFVDFIETRSCRDRWRRIEALTEGVTVSGDRLVLLPGCDCPGASEPCVCSAARVYQLLRDRAPVLASEDSRRLTRQILGVEFEGERRVVAPKTPEARVLPD